MKDAESTLDDGSSLNVSGLLVLHVKPKCKTSEHLSTRAFGLLCQTEVGSFHLLFAKFHRELLSFKIATDLEWNAFHVGEEASCRVFQLSEVRL